MEFWLSYSQLLVRACQALSLSPTSPRVKQATCRFHKGQLEHETVTALPINGHFEKPSSVGDTREDMHS